MFSLKIKGRCVQELYIVQTLIRSVDLLNSELSPEMRRGVNAIALCRRGLRSYCTENIDGLQSSKLKSSIASLNANMYLYISGNFLFMFHAGKGIPWPWEGVYSMKGAKAIGIQEALMSWIKNLNFDNIQIEMDTLQVHQSIQSTFLFSSYDYLIIKELANHFFNFYFCLLSVL